MSTIKNIVKQAEIFEHLAVYSDMATFLKRIAQVKSVDNEQIHTSLKSLENGLVAWKNKYRNGASEFGSLENLVFFIYSIVDSAQPLDDKLDKIAETAQKLAIIPNELKDKQEKYDWSTMVSVPAAKLVELINQKKEYETENIPAIDNSKVINIPTVEEKSYKYPSIPKELQTKLNTLVNEETYIKPDGTEATRPIPGKKPISIDGVLGPETQAALKEFSRKYFNTDYSNEELLTVLKNA